MSEKRLITWGSFKENCLAYNAPRKLRKCYYKDCECSQCNCERWQALPKPTLADVCGNRTLDSMTEEEIEELVKLYAGDFIGILLTHRNGDKDIYIEYTDVGLRKALIIYPGELSVGGKEVKIFKWFLEKGFKEKE